MSDSWAWLIISHLVVFFFGRKFTMPAIRNRLIKSVDFLIVVRSEVRRLVAAYRGHNNGDIDEVF